MQGTVMITMGTDYESSFPVEEDRVIISGADVELATAAVEVVAT